MRVENFPKPEQLKELNQLPFILKGPENLSEKALDRMSNILTMRAANFCTSARIHLDCLTEVEENAYDNDLANFVYSVLEKKGYNVSLTKLPHDNGKLFNVSW